MTLADQLDIIAQLARVDAGSAWNAAVLNATGCYAGRLGDEAYAELYPHRDLPTSGAFHPKGRAERVEGGYLVSGDWDWGSGSYIAEHVIGGCLAFADGEPIPAPSGKGQLTLGVWLPREAITSKDNWQTLGVRASGSTSYAVTEPVFVPERHTFDREAAPDPGRDPMNKHVTLAFFGLTGITLGIAQHIVDLTLQAARRRPSPPAPGDSTTLRSLGQAVMEVDMTYAALMDIARRSDEVISAPGQILTPVQEMRLTAAHTMAAEMLRRVLDLCLDVYGSRYLFDSDPMQRVVRDAYGAMAHVGTKRMQLGLLGVQLHQSDGDPTLFPTPDEVVL
jgi:alkylation response protein AidB-like acyl-CoA dehydrogenase